MSTTLNVGIHAGANEVVRPELDPEGVHAGGRFPAFITLHCLYDRLIHFAAGSGADGEPQWDLTALRPGLAEDWELSRDGRTLTVLLRETRSWRGNRLTASSIKWSWERAFQWHAVGEWIARLASVDSPDAIELADERTVRFKLSRPNYLAPTLLGYYVPPIYDATETGARVTTNDPWLREWLRENDAGFGPYRIEGRGREGEGITFAANPNHWEGVPRSERLALRFGEWHELIDALIAGEIDVLPGIPARYVDRLRGRADIEVTHIWDGAFELPLRLNVLQPPFDDKRVRQAFAHAVPYRRIIDEVFRGLARPFVSPLHLPEGGRGLPYETDASAARGLLRSAGHPEGIESELYYLAGEDLDELANVIVESVAEAGIRLRAVEMSGPTYRAGDGSMYAPKGRFPIVLRSGGYRTPVPRYALPHDFGDGPMGLANDGGYESPEIASLWRRILAEPDASIQSEMLREAERVIVNDSPWIWLCKVVYNTAFRRGVHCEDAWYPTSRPHPLYHRVWKNGT